MWNHKSVKINSTTFKFPCGDTEILTRNPHASNQIRWRYSRHMVVVTFMRELAGTIKLPACSRGNLVVLVRCQVWDKVSKEYFVSINNQNMTCDLGSFLHRGKECYAQRHCLLNHTRKFLVTANLCAKNWQC